MEGWGEGNGFYRCHAVGLDGGMRAVPCCCSLSAVAWLAAADEIIYEMRGRARVAGSCLFWPSCLLDRHPSLLEWTRAGLVDVGSCLL